MPGTSPRNWTPVWVAFGASWYDGAEPLPWSAHTALWRTLESHANHVRYRLGLGGVPRLAVAREGGSRGLTRGASGFETVSRAPSSTSGADRLRWRGASPRHPIRLSRCWPSPCWPRS